jgi:hypothetical protein
LEVQPGGKSESLRFAAWAAAVSAAMSCFEDDGVDDVDEAGGELVLLELPQAEIPMTEAATATTNHLSGGDSGMALPCGEPPVNPLKNTELPGTDSGSTL